MESHRSPILFSYPSKSVPDFRNHGLPQSAHLPHLQPGLQTAMGVPPPVPMVLSTSTMQTRRWNQQQSICCLWNKVLSYTKHARGRGYGQLKKKKKPAETSTWVSLFGCVPLQWHRNEVTAMNTCIEELGYIMWIMLCVKFALGHTFPLSFPRRQVGIPIMRAVRWDTGMIRWVPHLQEKMTILNFKNALGLTEKAQNK